MNSNSLVKQAALSDKVGGDGSVIEGTAIMKDDWLLIQVSFPSRYAWSRMKWLHWESNWCVERLKNWLWIRIHSI